LRLPSRRRQENFGAVNPRDILRGVLNLPISTWSYKGQTYRHIGAMAQDFYQTFNVGENDTTITTVDPDGVAFAAIQGLNEELKDRDARIEAQQQLTTLADKIKQQQLVIDALRGARLSEQRSGGNLQRRNKMKTAIKFMPMTAIVVASVITAQTHSNGDYTITQSAVASGGTSTGGASNIYIIEGTMGQAAAGTNSSNGSYSVKGGFWSAQLAPTAATVSVGGRILIEGASGKGIRNVTITVTDTSGASRSVSTGAGGKYRFDDLEAGQTYIFTVSARRYVFNQPTVVHSATENFDGLNFVGTSQF
jgi:hypothetical protein